MRLRASGFWDNTSGLLDFRLGIAFFLLLFTSLTSASENQRVFVNPEEALTRSATSGRPLLALATSPTCPPCQALKQTLATEPAITKLAAKYVVLQMDSQSAEFQYFLGKYPTELQGVPVVFLVRPDGASMYGQSGGMNLESFSDLLRFGLEESGAALADDLQKSYAGSLIRAQDALGEGQLLQALRSTSKIMNHGGFATTVLQARELRNSVVLALQQRLDKLDRRLVSPDTMHGAAFRLAELYSEMGDVPPRETAKSMLAHYQEQGFTRLAVSQGKELVQARQLERQGQIDKATERYRRIIELDSSSPTAEHAVQKLAILKARERRETASRQSSL